MKLALIARQKSPDAQLALAQVQQWQSQNQTHPANQLLPSPLDSVKPLLHASPRKVALFCR